MTSLPASIHNDLLSAYIDGQLTADERARVEKALGTDAQTRDNLAGLEHTVNLFREAPALAVPRPFVLSEQAVLAAGGRVRGGEQSGFWQRLLGPLTRAMPLATAAVAVLLLLTVAVPRFSSPQAVPMAAREEASAEIAAAPMAPAETQLMMTEEESADMAAGVMEAPAAEQVMDEAPAEMVEEARLFSQSDAAKDEVEEPPMAAMKAAPAEENAADSAPAPAASALTTLQIVLLVLLVVMLAATVLLRRRTLA